MYVIGQVSKFSMYAKWFFKWLSVFCLFILIISQLGTSDVNEVKDTPLKANPMKRKVLGVTDITSNINHDQDDIHIHIHNHGHNHDHDQEFKTEENVEINQTKNLKWKNLFENELIGLNSGENDKSGMFSIFKDVIVGDKFTELSKEYDVSLVSFASLDKLYWIPIVLRYI